jgi:predicted DNA-binding protein with PD1-like motif
MRRLVQPGPVSAERIESFLDQCTRREVTLTPGLSLADAITRPMAADAVQAAVLQIEGLALDPLCCVMPGPSDGPAHVAYFSPPRTAVGHCLIEQANVTFGCMDGIPRLHCHASWVEADGTRRGGHILLEESMVAAPCVVAAWTFRTLGIRAEPDPETNFPLLRPMRVKPAEDGATILARIRPNEDLCTAVETLAQRHGLRDALLRSGLGSLIGATFMDGRAVPDDATEVLVRHGAVRDGVAEIDLAVVDMRGEVHFGRLAKGKNAVCITFDVVLEASAGARP